MLQMLKELTIQGEITLNVYVFEAKKFIRVMASRRVKKSIRYVLRCT
jgi:hypothetical protein